MARGRAFLVGTHHGDLMTPSGGLGRQGLDTGGEDPVVVADQDPEGGHGRWGSADQAATEPSITGVPWAAAGRLL
jgi:hypothetical protein